MLAPLPPGDDDVIATFLAPAPAPPTAVDAPPAPGNVTTVRDDLALEDFLASPPVQDDAVLSACLGPPAPPAAGYAPPHPDDVVMAGCCGQAVSPPLPQVVSPPRDDAIISGCIAAPPPPVLDDVVMASCLGPPAPAAPAPAPTPWESWAGPWWGPKILAPSLRQQRQEEAQRSSLSSFGSGLGGLGRLSAVQEDFPKHSSTDDFLLKAILDEALEPRFCFTGAPGGRLRQALPGTPVHSQESQDDAALASILGSPHRKTPRQSGALLRLLGKMDGRRGDDDALLGALSTSPRASNPRRRKTGRKDALSQALESLTPSADVAAKVLGPGPESIPRSVLLSKVTALLERKAALRRAHQAELVAGGSGRGTRPEQFCQPVGVTVAADGSIFVADCGNRRIVRLPSGSRNEVEIIGEANWPSPIDLIYSTTATGGSCLLVSAGSGVHLLDLETKRFDVIAEGCLPSGLAVEASGSVVFADAYDHCVVRCTWKGGASRKVVAGVPCDSMASVPNETRLHRPFALTIDVDGALLVCDSGNHRILRFAKDLSGQVICGGEHGKGLHQLSYPRGLVLEPVTGAYLIADTFNHRVLRWRRGASRGEVLFGRRGHQLDQLNRPTALAVDHVRRRLLIADSGNHRILSVPL